MQLIRFGDAPASSPSLLLISDSEPLLSTAETWGESFGEDFVLFVPDRPLPTSSQVSGFVEDLRAAMARADIKRTTVFGIGSGATVAMELAVRAQRVVRRLMILDGASRIVPSMQERIIDKLEAVLPLGLPFRSLSKNFDARPTLHLLRCPTLVITSPHANTFLKEQGILLARRIPNSWNCHLRENAFVGVESGYARSGEPPSAELLHRLHEFLQLPVKRSQKNKKPLYQTGRILRSKYD